jgi:hypothetical protein
MRNIVRAIVYIWLIWIWGLYRYQHPTRYSSILIRTKSDIVAISTGSVVDSWVLVSWSTVSQSGESIITQLAAQLSWTEQSMPPLLKGALSGSTLGVEGDSGDAEGGETNPFGTTYITITDSQANQQSNGKDHSEPYINEDIDTSTCSTPRGRSVAGADWTLAFESDRANTDNVCIIEKRICTQWVLGGSYNNHTCYFNGQGWQYEYLGIRWSDSTTLINQAEQQLGISPSPSDDAGGVVGRGLGWGAYTDDTQWVSNYALIDANNTPSGRTNNWWRSSPSPSDDEGGEIRRGSGWGYDLWPILPRTPETKISANKEQQINPNGNGIQWIINNKWNSPRLKYSTDNIKLDPTEPARQQYLCKTPWWTEVFHNQHVIAFESSTVPQWQSCKSELRTCTYQYLRWSYTKPTCTIAWVENTNTNNPYTNNRWYYVNNYYYGSDYNYRYYDSNWNYNTNRYNDRYYQNYNYRYTAPYRWYNNCAVDGYGFVSHGSSLMMYSASSVWHGQACRSTMRMCNDGVLNGSTDYKYTYCNWTNNYNGSYNGSKIYETPITKYTQYDSNIRPYGTKSDPQAWSCSVANYGTLSSSDFLVMYRETNPAPWVACDSVVRTCTNGSLSWPSNYTGLRCNNIVSVCGDARRDTGEQCDHKDVNKSWRWSGWCSLACTPIQQITVVQEKCYDYTDTTKLCNGQNWWTVSDTCKQVRSCPTTKVNPGKVQFMAWEEINGNRSKDVCELYISGVKFSIVKCNTNEAVAPYQETYSHVIENVIPWSYQVVARAIDLYGQAWYRPQWPDPKTWNPVNTFRSQCFDVKSGEITHIRSWFKASMSTDDKKHPRWIMDPVNGQKELYPGC